MNANTPQANSATPTISNGMPTAGGEPITSARWMRPAPRAKNPSQARTTALIAVVTLRSAPSPTASSRTALPKCSTLSAPLIARMLKALPTTKRPTIPSSR